MNERHDALRELARDIGISPGDRSTVDRFLNEGHIDDVESLLFAFIEHHRNDVRPFNADAFLARLNLTKERIQALRKQRGMVLARNLPHYIVEV